MIVKINNMSLYIKKIIKIEEELAILDNNSYDTIEEAKKSILKYDILLENLVNLVIEIINDNKLVLIHKEELFLKSVKIVSSYIGSADDIEKYETIFNDLYENKKISEIQLNYFQDNLNTSRWE